MLLFRVIRFKEYRGCIKMYQESGIVYCIMATDEGKEREIKRLI